MKPASLAVMDGYNYAVIDFSDQFLRLTEKLRYSVIFICFWIPFVKASQMIKKT